MSWIKIKPNTAENGSESKKPGRRERLFSPVLLAAAVSLTLGGCSWTFLSKETADDGLSKLLEDDIQTGSVAAANGDTQLISQLKSLSEEDWRRAKAALAVAVDPHGSTDRVLWDNPKTLAKGSFAPDGPPFVKNDEICRNFKTVVTDQAETKNLHGTACRPSGGEWDITEIRAAPAAKTADNKAVKLAGIRAQASVTPKDAATDVAKAAQ